MTKLESKLLELGYEEQPQDETDWAYSEKTYHKYFGDKLVYIQIVIQNLFFETISCADCRVKYNIINEDLLKRQKMALEQLQKDLEVLKEYEH